MQQDNLWTKLKILREINVAWMHLCGKTNRHTPALDYKLNSLN